MWYTKTWKFRDNRSREKALEKALKWIKENDYHYEIRQIFVENALTVKYRKVG